MKTLVRMKCTQLGKDDDSPLTLKYNEGCECRIGPDLLKAFQAKNAVEILKEKKQEPSKKQSDSTPDVSSESSEASKSDDSEPAKVEEPKKQKGNKKKSK